MSDETQNPPTERAPDDAELSDESLENVAGGVILQKTLGCGCSGACGCSATAGLD